MSDSDLKIDKDQDYFMPAPIGNNRGGDISVNETLIYESDISPNKSPSLAHWQGPGEALGSAGPSTVYRKDDNMLAITSKEEAE